MNGLNEETIGDELRLNRIKLGLSLYKISEHVGVSENYLSMIERGVRKGVKDDILLKMAEAYNMEPSYLFKKFNKIPTPIVADINRYEALDETLLKISLDGKLNEDQKEKLYDQFKKLYDEAVGIDE